MIPTTTLRLVDGVRVVVPDSLELITPYVLQEQQDWFEDEIKFLRRLLQPGDRVIDIGANYGVYSLCMARVVGPAGRVWAFEPASSTARLLAEGIAANEFSQVTLERYALSNASGTAALSLSEHSELNALVHGPALSGASESVPVTTLDECFQRHDWRNLDFLKIDAEGEEANILAGGRQFFQQASPLVQYEIKVDATSVGLDLVRKFAELGYGSYRLVPGLGFLIPYAADATPDPYLLNLFACKPGRAAALAARGFLADAKAHSPANAMTQATDVLATIDRADTYQWRNTVARLPYGVKLAERWEQTMAAGNSAEVDIALSLYAVSRDTSLAPHARFEALSASVGLLGKLCEHQPAYLRLSSLARVARDFGSRKLSVAALKKLSHYILQENRVHTSEPFLAPGERFDSIAPDAGMGNWVLAAVLEELELAVHYSSFYTGGDARSRLENIQALGLASAEMVRRLRLVRQRFG